MQNKPMIEQITISASVTNTERLENVLINNGYIVVKFNERVWTVTKVVGAKP